MIKYLYPKKIISEKGITNSCGLFIKRPMQACLVCPNPINVKTGYIIIDFGKEIKGGIRIITTFFEKGILKPIRVRFGESLSETSSELGVDGACNDHSPRDFTYELAQLSDVNLGQTGFRFVRIDFKEDFNITIQSILAYSEEVDHPVVYRYNGNDKNIKKIYDVGKRTIDLCSSGDYVWDGVKRDRLVWFGDLYPEVLALATLYGRHKSLERSLVLATEQYPLGTWMNGFPTYSMWWLASVSDYYNISKCKEFIKPLLQYAEGLVKQMNDCVDNDGNMTYPFYFVDWPTHEKPEENIGSRYINIFAIKKIIKIFEIFNCDTKIANELLAKLIKIDQVVYFKQVIALKYFALGKISDNEYKNLIDGGSKGISTFMSYFILSSIAARDKNLAVQIMKDYHMGMINLGATTFFEDFDADFAKECGRIDKIHNKKDFHRTFGDYCYKGFRHSLCHGWSTGVIRFIYENC